MLYYITPREDLLKPVKEVEGTSHADDEKYINRNVTINNKLITNNKNKKQKNKQMNKI